MRLNKLVETYPPRIMVRGEARVSINSGTWRHCGRERGHAHLPHAHEGALCPGTTFSGSVRPVVDVSHLSERDPALLPHLVKRREVTGILARDAATVVDGETTHIVRYIAIVPFTETRSVLFSKVSERWLKRRKRDAEARKKGGPALPLQPEEPEETD